MSPIDLLPQLGRDLAQVQIRLNETDEARLAAYQKRDEAEYQRQDRLYQALRDREVALQYAISDQRAGGLEGAVVQLLVVSGLAGIININEHSDFTDELYRMNEKMLNSIMVALERETGARREDFGGEDYMSRDLDPHLMAGVTAAGRAEP